MNTVLYSILIAFGFLVNDDPVTALVLIVAATWLLTLSKDIYKYFSRNSGVQEQFK